MPKVRLLVSRTGVGKIGDVVEYDDATAQDHAQRGLVELVGDEEVDGNNNGPPKPRERKSGKAK